MSVSKRVSGRVECFVERQVRPWAFGDEQHEAHDERQAPGGRPGAAPARDRFRQALEHEEEQRDGQIELLLERESDQPQNMTTSPRASEMKFVA